MSVEFQPESNLEGQTMEKNHNRCECNCGRVKKWTHGLGHKIGIGQLPWSYTIYMKHPLIFILQPLFSSPFYIMP